MRLTTILLLGVVVIALIGERQVSGVVAAKKRDAIPAEDIESPETETEGNAGAKDRKEIYNRYEPSYGYGYGGAQFGGFSFWKKRAAHAKRSKHGLGHGRRAAPLAY